MPLVTSTSRFVLNGRNSDVTMADFVEWYYSNTTAPAVRSILAEYIVVSAIGAVGSNTPRHIHLHSESIIHYRRIQPDRRISRIFGICRSSAPNSHFIQTTQSTLRCLHILCI